MTILLLLLSAKIWNLYLGKALEVRNSVINPPTSEFSQHYFNFFNKYNSVQRGVTAEPWDWIETIPSYSCASVKYA